MNLEIKTGEILNILERASRATGKNLSLPVLSCLYLEADKSSGTLDIKATNLDIGVNFKTKIKCTVGGTVAIPANILLNFLSSTNPDTNLLIETTNNNLVIKAKNNQTVIKCLPIEDFPDIPVVQSDKQASIKTKDFVNGIKSVWYSASNSTIKPELASVYITAGEQELVFVSTDSFRLAEKRVYYKNPIDFQAILVPHKNIPDMVKILDGYNDDVKIIFDKNQINFSFGDNKMVSRLIDGSFPDYKQIIPKSPQTEVVVLKSDFVNTIRRAQMFSDAFNQVRFRVNPADKKFSLTAKNNDVGEYSEDIVSKLTGDSVEISFNHKYIVDCLQSIDSPSLLLSLSGAGKPMIIKGAGDKSFMYMVMPMNR